MSGMMFLVGIYVFVAYLVLLGLIFIVLKCYERGTPLPPRMVRYFILLSVFWPATVIGTAYNFVFGE